MLAGLLMLSTAACAQVESSPSFSTIAAPSAAVPQPADHTLLVRVHARGSETPIGGALVRHKLDGYYTSPSGEARVTVASGEETTISVSAPDFHSMEASGTLNCDEQWTFYLEAEPNP